MRLRDLDGQLVRREPAANGNDSYAPVATVAEADGVMFICPACVAKLGTVIGAHSVLCWFVGKVPDDLDPKPGRWIPSGTTIDDLSFVGPQAASVLLEGSECGWHGYVKDGAATLTMTEVPEPKLVIDADAFERCLADIAATTEQLRRDREIDPVHLNIPCDAPARAQR